MGSACSRAGKQNKTHPFKTPNHSPNLQDREELPSPKSNLCSLLFRNSKKQPTNNFLYPKISIYRKLPRPPLKPTPPPPPPTYNHVPWSSHSQETPPPCMYMYDGIKRQLDDPNVLHSKSEQQPMISQMSPQTPRPTSYIYEGRAKQIQDNAQIKVSDPKPITPPPSTYLYDGLQSPPAQQPAVPKFGQWYEEDDPTVSYTQYFKKESKERQWYKGGSRSAHLQQSGRGKAKEYSGKWKTC